MTEGLGNRGFIGHFKDGFVAGKLADEATFNAKETFGLVWWWHLELKNHTPVKGEGESQILAVKIVRAARATGKAASRTIVWMGPTWR